MPTPAAGTVTFLFTDIEGSTRLLRELGPQYADLVAGYHGLLRTTFAAHGGQEVDTQGDGAFYVFPRARNALSAAVAVQQALATQQWPRSVSPRVRIGVHTGEPFEEADRYIGMDVHRAARICAAGHGGQILVSETTRDLVAEDLPGGIGLRDLGEHRLKDLTRPQRLFQVVAPGLAAKFPSLRSLEVLPNNLPTQVTSFIGREKEMTEVKELLSATRLLTLIGPGGTGKTRLALQVAADLLEHYPDGVWLADLAPMTDPALVPQALISALGIRGLPWDDLMETLLNHLRSRSLLIVLDNCEHLLSACARLADAVLRDCATVRALATSREDLGIAGESLYPVPPLALPDSDQFPGAESARQYEGIRLFVERASAAKPTFTIQERNAATVVRICRRLDGIPLAIEMAAARVKALSVEEIASRLEDRFRLLVAGSRTALPRQQTLRATLDWSFDLLSPREQILLGRLSVFSGGFSIDAAEAVCSDGPIQEVEVLELLTELVEKSLVTMDERVEGTRYRLLETVREYARSKLTDSGEADAVALRHLRYFSNLGTALERDPTIMFDSWLSRVEVDDFNLRAAIDWALAGEHTEAGLELAGALWRFWFHRGHLDEGRRLLMRALTNPVGAPDALRIKAINGAAFLTLWQDDYKGAVVLSEESLALSRPLNDLQGTALALAIQGHAVWHAGDKARGVAAGQEAVSLARQSGDKRTLLWALRELSYVLWHMGDIDQGEELFEEHLTLCRQLGDTSAARDALRLVAEAALHRKNYARAAMLCEEALAISLFYKDMVITAVLEVALGHALAGQEKYAEAQAHYKETLGKLHAVRQQWWIARCLDGLGRVSVAEQRHPRAVRLFGAATALRADIGDPPPSDQSHIDTALAVAREALGDEAFEAAWNEGRAMTLDQAVQYALE